MATSSQDIIVTGLSGFKSISPASGSINGGTIVTIVGNGFDKSTIVSFQTAKCNVIQFTVNTLNCVTSANPAAIANIQLRYFEN